jgi:hypothetical protein
MIMTSRNQVFLTTRLARQTRNRRVYATLLSST